MTGAGSPLVGVVVVTHDQERFVGAALASVLGQEYPRDRVEIVVVDDGSTDGTAAALAPFADRARIVRQANRGHLGAYDRGLAELGPVDLIALLDGDDVWLPDKLGRQVALLAGRPEVGMVYGDMEVIDEHDRTLAPSYWAESGLTPPRGNGFGALLRHNFAQTSTILVRAALKPRFHPIPDWARAQDWWIGLRVSEVAGVDHPAGVVSRYRRHGGNLWYRTDGERQLQLRRRELTLRRHLLGGVAPGRATLDEVLGALQELHHVLDVVHRGLGIPVDELAPVSAEQAEHASEALARARAALAAGDSEAAALACVNALAHDPRLAPAADVLREALERPAPRRAAARRGAAAPRVTCVLTAYDVGPYVGAAVESALAQDYHGEVEVVAVDDGSTDGTADVLASFGDRIRVVSQENRGFIAAVSVGLSAATGQYLALLDGDDEWTPDKVRLQVDELEARPELGLVHGDMELIDASGAPLHPSFFAAVNPPRARGDVFGELLRGNFVSGGASMFRRSLLPAVLPIEPAAAFPDWWIAVRVAELAWIDHLDVPVNRYRRHEANMSSGLEARMADEVRFRRFILERLALSRAPLDDLLVCLHTLDLQQARLELRPVGDATAAAAAAERARAALAGDDVEGAVRHALCALGHDPECAEARELVSLGGIAARIAPARPDGVRAIALAADVDDLLAEPGLLRAYATAFTDVDPVTLVVCAPGWSDERIAAELAPAVTAAGIDGDASPDVLAVAAQPSHVAADALYRHASDLPRLRALAARVAA